MKKILLNLTFATLLTSVLHADMGRLEVGIGSWQQTPSGDLSYEEYGLYGKDTSREEQTNEAYVWMLIKHPIPILPNLRVEYSHVKNEGTATGSFENFSVFPGTTANTSLELTELDVVPYYNILDNTAWITLDLGVDFKIIESTYEANNVKLFGFINTPMTYTDESTTVIPLAYLRTRVEIPKTGFGIEGDVKYITYSGSTIYDVRAKVDYTFDTGLPVDIGFEVGYRIKNMQIDDEEASSTNTNLDFRGVYAGVMFRY